MRKIVVQFSLVALVVCSLFSCESDRIAENALIAPPTGNNEQTLPEWVEKMENPMIDWVKVYPGEVTMAEPRIASAVVKINPYYKKNSPAMGNNGGTPLFSTGYYAAPAEMITIVVPASLEGKKVNYVINIDPCNLDKPCTGGGAVANQKRYSYIRTSGTLSVGENKVFNYFGGHIYLTFDQELMGEYDFEIRGAVKSPDFIEGGDVQAWKQALETTGVPYGEIRSKHYILTLAVKHLKNIPDPQKVCDFYNEFIKICYNDFFGFEEDYAQPSVVPNNMRAVMTPWRSFCDYQMCGGAAHSGYPTVFGQSYEPRMANLEELLRAGHWGLWHENGHNFQQSKWKWSTQGEVTCNINIFKWYYKKLGYWAEGSRLTAFQGAAENYVAKDLVGKDFEKRSGDEQICPYIQLAYGLGWGVYKYLGIQNRTSKEATSDDQAKKDFFAKRVAEYAGANMMPFFDGWGIPVSRGARLYIEAFPDWSETSRGQQMGEFWKHFNYGPVTDTEAFDDYREPDPSTFPEVTVTTGDFDRTGWNVTSTAAVYDKDKTVFGAPQYVIDNSNTTCIALVKPGKTYDGVTGKDPMDFVVDMGGKKTFNYVKINNRSGYANLSVQKLSLYGSNTGNADDFKAIKEGIATDKSSGSQQKLALGKDFAYRYIKVKYDAWDTSSGSTVQMADFRVGID